jgi:hypothetical protein
LEQEKHGQNSASVTVGVLIFLKHPQNPPSIVKCDGICPVIETSYHSEPHIQYVSPNRTILQAPNIRPLLQSVEWVDKRLMTNDLPVCMAMLVVVRFHVCPPSLEMMAAAEAEAAAAEVWQ